MIPPRYWPTQLWVAAIAVAVLAASGIALGIHLALVGPAADSYLEHVIAAFIPGLVILGIGAAAAGSVMRDDQDQVAATGRAFVLGFVLMGLALLGLGMTVFSPIASTADR